jgi:hypothetical protein
MQNVAMLIFIKLRVFAPVREAKLKSNLNEPFPFRQRGDTSSPGIFPRSFVGKAEELEKGQDHRHNDGQGQKEKRSD